MSTLAITRIPLWPVAVVLAAAGALAGALVAQHLFGLEPCVLCIYQRYAHGVSLALGLAALAAAGQTRRWLLAACGLAFLGGAGIAGFHVGVEQHWWQGLSGCEALALDPQADLEQLREALLAAPVVRCDEVPWSLFGISMAGYNLLFSLALGAAVLRAALLGLSREVRS